MKYVVQVMVDGKWKDYITKTRDNEARQIAKTIAAETELRTGVVVRDDKGRPA